MRIGILTYHFVPNFGANLQTLSTIEYLKNHGHEPIVINWQPSDLVRAYEKRVSLAQRNKHSDFVKKYFYLTNICTYEDEIIREIKKNKIEAIIVGSDVVLSYESWKSQFKIFKSRMPFRIVKRTSDNVFPNPFWLNFLTKEPELANLPTALMSVSSMGSNFLDIPMKVKQGMRVQLKKFKFISVRDSWTKQMVKTLSLNNIEPEITPDPVFGFNQNIGFGCTKDEILKKFNLPDKYIVVSFRDKYISSDWIKNFEKLSEQANFNCVELAVPEGTLNFQLKQKIDIPLDPLDWYNIIRHSSGYVGQNMHPVVICLHNCIPFYSFDDYGKVGYKNDDTIPSKIFDLLHRTSFAENCFNVNVDGVNLMTPTELISIITRFDYEKCENVSIKLQDEYNNMMEKMLKF